MSEHSLNSATTTDLSIKPYSVTPQSLDFQESGGSEIFIDFPNAPKFIGYYKGYGQLKKAIDTLAIYVVGKGYSCDDRNKVILDHLSGYGNDSSHEIFWNMFVMSLVIGDSFAEIIRSDKGTLLNLKPISAERVRVVLGSNGYIKKYQVKKLDGTFQDLKKENMLHLCNDRIGDEQHGTSVIESCMWVIDALEEARRDYRVVLHRNVVPVRIIEIDTENETEQTRLKLKYKEAITKGEVLIVPKGTINISNNEISVQDPIAWIQSLENYFYLAVGIPRVIASPDGLSEGSSKVGYLVFEPIYSYRQILFESDLWSQVGIKLKFNRPASLSDNIQSNEDKNTSQLNFQPKDMAVNINRE